MTMLPDVEQAVLDAIQRDHRRSRSSRRARWNFWLTRARRGRPLAVIAALVLGGTTGALAATGVFRTGSPVEPAAPALPTTDNGIAIAGSVRLLALRVPDPAGGLPWGARVLRTTRGDTCIQVGRVLSGTLGVLGQDGAFRDDGRFHPFSANVEGPLDCGISDAHGRAFFNDTLINVPASGFTGGCRIGSKGRHAFPRCPPADLRYAYYGLLGPDATSVTYANSTGHLVTTLTAGSDGAYLVVLMPPRSCDPGRGAVVCAPSYAGVGASGLRPGAPIRTVSYRNHSTCHLAPIDPASHYNGERASCPTYGYAAPPTPRLTSAQVASPVTVREEPSKHYCGNDTTFAPCGGVAPRGFHELIQPPSLLVSLSFISRVGIRSSGDYYDINLENPPGASGGSSHCDLPRGFRSGEGGQTNTDYAAGQRVYDLEFVPPCRGVIHGTVILTVGGNPTDHLPRPIGHGGLLVSRFSFNVP